MTFIPGVWLERAHSPSPSLIIYPPPALCVVNIEKARLVWNDHVYLGLSDPFVVNLLAVWWYIYYPLLRRRWAYGPWKAAQSRSKWLRKCGQNSIDCCSGIWVKTIGGSWSPRLCRVSVRLNSVIMCSQNGAGFSMMRPLRLPHFVVAGMIACVELSWSYQHLAGYGK